MTGGTGRVVIFSELKIAIEEHQGTILVTWELAVAIKGWLGTPRGHLGAQRSTFMDLEWIWGRSWGSVSGH